MKTKKQPTHDQIVDFYYRLLMYLDRDGYVFPEHDELFEENPSEYSRFVDSDLTNWPREISPEEYEFYINERGLINLKSVAKYFSRSKTKDNVYKHKIKITICED